MSWPHTVHNNTRESPRYILTIIIFVIKKKIKSSITPLIFIFITYYYFAKKRPSFKSNFIYIYIKIFVTLFFSLILYFWESNLYSRFLIFAFWYLYQFCTFKNPIFSTHFYLGARLLAGLLSPTLDSPFSPPGRLYLLPPPPLLYPTLNLFACSGLWRTPRELITGWICLSPFDSPFYPPGHLCLLPPSSLLCVTLWRSLRDPYCGEHIGKGLLAGSVSLLLIPPFILLDTSVSFLPLLFSV